MNESSGLVQHVRKIRRDLLNLHYTVFKLRKHSLTRRRIRVALDQEKMPSRHSPESNTPHRTLWSGWLAALLTQLCSGPSRLGLMNSNDLWLNGRVISYGPWLNSIPPPFKRAHSTIVGFPSLGPGREFGGYIFIEDATTMVRVNVGEGKTNSYY